MEIIKGCFVSDNSGNTTSRKGIVVEVPEDKLGKCSNYKVIWDDGSYELYNPNYFENNFSKVDSDYDRLTNLYYDYKKSCYKSSTGEQNKPERIKMKELTPMVIQTFDEDERVLFRAGFLNEDKSWSSMAKDLSTQLFLNSQKKELVKLAKELIEEERENMIGKFMQKKLNKNDNE